MDQTVTFQEHPKWVPGRIAEAYIHAGIMRTRILKVKALISLGMQIQRIKYITRGKEGVCIWQNKTKQQADRKMLSGWGSQPQEKELRWPKRGPCTVLRQLITGSQSKTSAEKTEAQIFCGCSCNNENFWLLFTCVPYRRNSVSREIKIKQRKSE